MDVYCVYCVHCVHHTYYAYWTKPTKVQPSTNWCRVGVSIVNTKMDTMDIHCVHWTCPLVIKNGQTLSIVSIGDHWTFSTIEVHVQWTSNGRPMWTMDGHQCEQYEQWKQWSTSTTLVSLLPHFVLLKENKYEINLLHFYFKISYIPIPNTTKQQTSTRSSKPQSPKRGQRLKLTGTELRGHSLRRLWECSMLISCLLLITFISNHKVAIELVT